MASDLIGDLHLTLGLRRRPEDIAEMILEGAGEAFSGEERALLDKAAEDSLKRRMSGFTSLGEAFFHAVPLGSSVSVAQDLFRTAAKLTPAEYADVKRLREFVNEISTEIHKATGANSFKTDRMNRAVRKAGGLELSRRRYNKLFRFLTRFERKIETYERQINAIDAQMIGKSGLAARIPAATFAASPDAAYFIAYYVARRNRRSTFTSGAQERAYDEVSEMLLTRFKRRPNDASWLAIAYVMPDADIVSQLSEAAKLDLFTAWLDVLRDIADQLQVASGKAGFDRATMIVTKGDDSSTWNALAGAWNMARQGWLGAIHALGMEDVLDLVCLGKVMRLMAGDVAALHRAGGGVDPDTLVWAELPAPWDVFAGNATCTRRDVEIACAIHGVDPVGRRWVAPRSGRIAVPYRPTPELVHGVVVSHPELAAVLRQAGWFSGKSARPLPEGVAVDIARDATGAVLSVTPAPSAEKSRDAWQWIRKWWKDDPV